MAVIGGGLTGTAAAFFLRRAGAEVVLIEAEGVGARASGANAGSLHVQIPHEPFVSLGEGWARRFAPVLPLLLDSIDLWRNAEADTGADLELAMPGGILVGFSDREMRAIEAKAAIERAAGVSVEILSGADLRERAPYLSPAVAGGAFCPTEGKANPMVCAPAFAKKAKSMGVSFRLGESVTAIRREAEGFQLALPKGAVAARRVINAAGAEAGRIAALLGLSLAVEAFPIQLTATAPAEPLIGHLVYAASEKLTLKQTRIGSILIGGGWPARLDAQGRPQVDPKSLAENLAVARRVVPALAGAEALRTWAAFVNGNDDWRPIIGETARVPGFILAYAPWIGFTASLAVARAAADAALGRRSEGRADLAEFLPD